MFALNERDYKLRKARKSLRILLVCLLPNEVTDEKVLSNFEWIVVILFLFEMQSLFLGKNVAFSWSMEAEKNLVYLFSGETKSRRRNNLS